METSNIPLKTFASQTSSLKCFTCRHDYFLQMTSQTVTTALATIIENPSKVEDKGVVIAFGLNRVNRASRVSCVGVSAPIPSQCIGQDFYTLKESGECVLLPDTPKKPIT